MEIGSEGPGTIIENTGSSTKRIMLGIPMTGTLRAEWVLARYGQLTPCNWSVIEYTAWIDQYSPLRFSVPDARNLVVEEFLRVGAEWLFFLDHDVILPPTTLIKLNEYMHSAEYPIVNGLYFTKSMPAEPLIYRGRGNSYYGKWKFGDKVWADGAGLGCTLIHSSILKAVHAKSERYVIMNKEVGRVFSNPRASTFNEETKLWDTITGTEDLSFYTRLQREGIYKEAGWDKYQKMRYPLLIDTSIYCKHIDFNGMQYPHRNDELLYTK